MIFMTLRLSAESVSRTSRCLALLTVCGLLASACVTVRANLSADELWNIELPDGGGRLVSLSTCRGKLMLLDVFVTWSQASMAAIPGYEAMYLNYRSRGLCMIGIALDELGAKVVVPFNAGMKIPYPVLLADKSIKDGSSPLGKLPITPMLMLFDRSGKLRKVIAGFVDPRIVEKLILQLL